VTEKEGGKLRLVKGERKIGNVHQSKNTGQSQGYARGSGKPFTVLLRLPSWRRPAKNSILGSLKHSKDVLKSQTELTLENQVQSKSLAWKTCQPRFSGAKHITISGHSEIGRGLSEGEVRGHRFRVVHSSLIMEVEYRIQEQEKGRQCLRCQSSTMQPGTTICEIHNPSSAGIST